MKITARIENGIPTLRVYGYSGSLNTYFPNCRFERGPNCWVMPYGHLHALMALFPRLPYVYVNEMESGVANALLPALKKQELSDDYVWKTKPYRHQVEGYYFGIACPRFLLADEQGLGKALSLNTKIYTPEGYKEMRDIGVGDHVFNRHGKPVKVTATYFNRNVNMYRVAFSDGKSVECCEDHLWLIYDNRDYKVVDTKWFVGKDQFGNSRVEGLVHNGCGHHRYCIPRCEPAEFNGREVPIHPYVLGALLGDGCFRSGSVGFTSNDAWIVERMNALLPKGHFLHSSESMNDNSYHVVAAVGRSRNTNVVKQALVGMGLWEKDSHTKFVPDCYKYNSVEVRKEILRGLLDTDGYAMNSNVLQFTSVSKRLVEDVEFLVESLGGLANVSQKECGYGGKVTGIAYTITARFDDPSDFVTLPRKAERLWPRKFKPRRNIVSVEYIGRQDAKCITVDDPEGLYLAEHFIVTHNTKQSIDLAVNRRGMYGIRHCLIICGVSALRFNWKSEVGIHSDEGCLILGERVLRNGRVALKGTKEKLADAERLANGDTDVPFFVVTNIESTRVDSIRKALVDACGNGQIGMIVFDEFHRAKNPQAKQGKAILEIRAPYEMAMTGTPVLNTPLDLYTALAWLGLETHNFYQFRRFYCHMAGNQITGYKNQDLLRESLRGHMLRRRKEDELPDLPPKIYTNEYLELEGPQREVYEAIKEDIKSNLVDVYAAPNPLAKMVRLRQATGYPGLVSESVTESVKLRRMVEIVDDCVSNGKKCVVFTNWSQVANEALRLLSPQNPVLFTGELKDWEAEANKERFMQDPSCKVLVGTIGKMGVGLTLTAATTCVFLDEPWNQGTKEQCEDRLHRIGTKEPVSIITLLCKDTIDERINSLVYAKGAMAEWLVDGRVSKKHHRETVDFLLS